MLQNNPALKAKIDQLWDKFWSGEIINRGSESARGQRQR